jgi:predicted nucleotidyltransferase
MTLKTAKYKSVQDEITWIEGEFDVEVLLAVEHGSRLWGLAGPSSDHDIKFIYKNKPERAFSLFDRRNFIGHKCEIEADTGFVEVEMTGWSIEKALRLSVSSNPQLNEIIGSPLRYAESDVFCRDLKGICKDSSPRTIAHYYRGTAKKTLLGDICRHRGADLKANLQMVRAFMSSIWMVQNPKVGSFPPLDFAKLREEVDLSSGFRPYQSFDTQLDEIVELKTTTSKRRVDQFFVIIEQWGLQVMDSINDDILKIPEHWVDQNNAELCFRHQYPETFSLVDDAPQPA